MVFGPRAKGYNEYIPQYFFSPGLMSHTHRSIPPPAPGPEQRGDPGHQRLQWSVPVQPIRREWAPGTDGTLAADSFFLILSNQNRRCTPPNKLLRLLGAGAWYLVNFGAIDNFILYFRCKWGCIFGGASFAGTQIFGHAYWVDN